MTSSSHQPADGASRARRIIAAALVALLLAVLFLLVPRHRPGPTTAPLPEVHRKNLEMRAGVWHAPGEIRGFTGVLLDTYDDGSLKSRSAVSNGLLHGISQGWYTNGQQQVEEHFVAGTSHGLRSKWHLNGQKLSEVTVVGGKLQGTFRSWHENGQCAEEVELREGQPDGLSRAYYASGFLKSQVTLRNGKVVEQQFYKEGSVAADVRKL